MLHTLPVGGFVNTGSKRQKYIIRWYQLILSLSFGGGGGDEELLKRRRERVCVCRLKTLMVCGWNVVIVCVVKKCKCIYDNVVICSVLLYGIKTSMLYQHFTQSIILISIIIAWLVLLLVNGTRKMKRLISSCGRFWEWGWYIAGIWYGLTFAAFCKKMTLMWSARGNISWCDLGMILFKIGSLYSIPSLWYFPLCNFPPKGTASYRSTLLFVCCLCIKLMI